MTVNDLFEIHKSTTAATRYYNHGEVDKFYKKYSRIIRDANEKLMGLVLEYCEMENNAPKIVDGKMVFKKSEEEYHAEMNKILNRQV